MSDTDRKALQDALRYGNRREVAEAVRDMDFDDVRDVFEAEGVGRVRRHSVEARGYAIERRGYGSRFRE